MKMLQVTGAAESEIISQAPEPLVSGQVRVAVNYCGVCHSDVGEHSDPAGIPGRGLGHEISGRVIETESAQFQVGDRVVVLNYQGYATEVVEDHDFLLPIPDSVSTRLACMAEPVACILSGLDRVDLTRASTAAVVGAGFMGLVLIRALVIRGISVTVYEPREEARARAIEFGATDARDSSAPSPSESSNYALVFECSGASSGLELASTLVAIEGTLSIVGYHQSQAGMREVPMQSWNYRALNIVNAHTRSHLRVLFYMQRALQMFASGVLELSDLITGSVELHEVPSVLSEAGPVRLRDHVKLVAAVVPDE